MTFHRAYLGGADLSHARLDDAHLSHVHLDRATLCGAYLIGAHLSSAYLVDADFRGAHLTEAVFYHTTFGNTKLGDVGLASCQHYGPSNLDHRTLTKSWPLPLAFLRGCGLPESFITYLPSLLNQPIQFYSCFISYSTKDQPFADRLYADLQNKGVRCWFAPHDMAPGQKIHEQIEKPSASTTNSCSSSPSTA